MNVGHWIKCNTMTRFLWLSRWSVGAARIIITAPDTLWTERRWEPPSGWLATLSPGEPPSRLPTCTTETAWLMTMGRSTQLYVISFDTCWCGFSWRESSASACNPSLSPCSVSRMCRWGSLTSRGDQKGKLLILQLWHNFLLAGLSSSKNSTLTDDKTFNKTRLLLDALMRVRRTFCQLKRYAVSFSSCYPLKNKVSEETFWGGTERENDQDLWWDKFAKVRIKKKLFL